MTTFFPSLEKSQQWIHHNRSQWLDDYFTFLRFPSISSEKNYANAMYACANWLSDQLKAMEFEVEIWETEGHPVVFASSMQAGPEQPTLLLYHHYDVQPVDPLEEWDSPPFEPIIKNGCVYARGAQDNKGQCFYTLQALKMLYEQTHGKLPLNIKLCIEGEEEIGSLHLAPILHKKKEQLKADYLAIVDLGLQQADRPALTLGVRGILTMDIEVQASKLDLHSGSNGGMVLNPIHVLVNLLSQLRDEQGRITIPGFYHDVGMMTKEELACVSFQFDEKEYLAQTGAFPIGGEREFSPLERAWNRPTLEINGISGGYTGNGFKTVIPAKAHAKISCRLVSNQNPDTIGKLVARFIEELAPEGVKVTVHVHPGKGKAMRVSPQATVVKAFARAYEDVYFQPCEFIFEGGSIPIVPELAEVCGGETLLCGLGLGTDAIHAPNEHFSLDRIEKGICIIAQAIHYLSHPKI